MQAELNLLLHQDLKISKELRFRLEKIWITVEEKNVLKVEKNFLNKNSFFTNRAQEKVSDSFKQKTSSIMNFSMIKKKTVVLDSAEDKKNTPEYLKNKGTSQNPNFNNVDFFSYFNNKKVVNFYNLDDEEKQQLDDIVDSFKKKSEEKVKYTSEFKKNVEDVKKKLDYSSHQNLKKSFPNYTSIGQKSQNQLQITENQIQNPPKSSNFNPKYINFAESRRHQRLKSSNYNVLSPRNNDPTPPKKVTSTSQGMAQYHFNLSQRHG